MHAETISGSRSDLIYSASSSSVLTASTAPATTSNPTVTKLGFSYLLLSDQAAKPQAAATTATAKTTATAALTTTAKAATTTTAKAAAAKTAIPAKPAYPSISGYAYVDSNKNGKKDKGEWAISGARIVLKPKKYENDPRYWLNMVTASDGSYYFDLRKKVQPWLGYGTYSVWELVQPGTKGQFVDGYDRPASVVNRYGEPVNGKGQVVPATPRQTSWGYGVNGQHAYDAMRNITIPSNGYASNYNFGETSLDPKYVSKRMFLSNSSSTVNVKAYPMPSVPEPGTIALLGTGALGLVGAAWFRRRRRRAR
jgi:hypothetical protein